MKLEKLDYPQIVPYLDTLPIRINKLHLWRHYGSGITLHYLDSPKVERDKIDWLDYFKGNKN